MAVNWRSPSRRLCLVVLVCSLGCSGVALGVAAGSPEIDATVSENRLVPGTEATLELRLTNAGTLDTLSTTNPTLNQRVLTATGVSVTLDAGEAPLSVRSGPQGVGSLPDGGERTLPFTVSVDDDAAPGTYQLPVTVEYRHASRIYERGGAPEFETVTERLSVPVEVLGRARLAVVDTGSPPTGDDGTVTVTVANTGTDAATRTSVTLASLDPAVDLDGAPAASRFLGTVDVGETRTLSYDVSAADSATTAAYPFSLTANFTTDRGAAVSSPPVRVGIPVPGQPTFALDGRDTSLTVGEEGAVGGTVTNTGGSAAGNAVVVVESPSQHISVPERTYAVGTLGAGESASFAFDAVANETAEAGPRPVTVTVRYEGFDGVTRESDPLQLRTTVEPRRERLEFDAVNATYAPDSENRLDVRVRNTGPDRLEDVRLQLVTEPPFASVSPTAFVDALPANETATAGFELTVDEDAVESTHALGLRATMETADGRTVRTDTALVTVVIADPDGPGRNGTVVGGAAVVTALILVAGWWWLRG